jgi:hypothetical protein
MKALLCLALCLIWLGCSKEKNEETSASSTPSASRGTSAESGGGEQTAEATQSLPSAEEMEAQNEQASQIADRMAAGEVIDPSELPNQGRVLPGQVHPLYTSLLRRFITEKGRMPNHFAELVSSKMDSSPSPPVGTEYIIDEPSRTVRLVRRK